MNIDKNCVYLICKNVIHPLDYNRHDHSDTYLTLHL